MKTCADPRELRKEHACQGRCSCYVNHRCVKDCTCNGCHTKVRHVESLLGKGSTADRAVWAKARTMGVE